MSETFGQETRADMDVTSSRIRSIRGLAGDAVSQLAKLIGNEFELARAELSAKAGQVGRAATMIGAGAILLIPALVVLLFAIATAIMEAGLSRPVAYAVTGGGALIIALILLMIGASRLSADKLRPALTLEQVQRDRMAVKEMTR